MRTSTRICRTLLLSLAPLCCAVQASAAQDLPLQSFSGVWVNTLPTAQVRPVEGGAPPLNLQGKANYAAIRAGRRSGQQIDDARHLCLPEGMPRALGSAYPMQILVTPGQLTFVHEANRAYRMVHLDRPHADPAVWDPTYMVEGTARYNDAVLTIDSVNYKGARIFLDDAGLPVSDQLHLTEQLRLLDNGQILEDVVTIEDPVNYSRAWRLRFAFARRDDVQLRTDWVCGEPHRQLSSLRKPAKPILPAAASATSTPLGAVPLLLNGYWRGDRRPLAGTAHIATEPAKADGPPLGPGGIPSIILTAALPQLQPWAADFRRRFLAAEAQGQQQRTPGNLCLPYAIPGTGVPGGPAYSMQLLIEPHHVAFLYQENRQIRIARIGGEHPPRLTPGWLGDSIAHWEGNTLVVDTIGFNDSNLMGDTVPFTQAMHIVQRLSVEDGKLVDRAVFTDPKTFNQPFEAVHRFEATEPFQEYLCAEDNREGGVPTDSGKPTPYRLPGATTTAEGLRTR